MTKQLFLCLFAMITTTCGVMAQETLRAAPTEHQRQQKAPNALTKETILLLQQELGLSNDQLAKTYQPFFDFFTSIHNAMSEMRAAGNVDREVKRSRRDQFTAERDMKLKDVFSVEQMKKFKEVVEPAMEAQ
ncbi:MAG: hypothetical protein WKF88_03825 [Ferruginibacter sp.]